MIPISRASNSIALTALATLLGAMSARADDLPLRTSVSQHGITWTFSEPVPVGQFVNGDYYVVGPVTVTAIAPAPTYGSNARNGSTLNPPPSGYCGYDGRIINYFRSALTAPLPVAMAPGDSLVSTISVDVMGQIPNMLRPQDHSTRPVKTAAVLTCMAEQVPEDAFRPSFMDTGNTVYLAGNLRRHLLPELPRVAHTPALAEYERYLERPWADTAWFGFAAPMENMPVYGREFARLGGIASLLLCLDFTPEEKETLLVRFVQLGIDLWGMARSGHRGWNAHGGHHSGRKWTIIFAGILLGDADMQRPNTSCPDVDFQEDMQTIYGQGWNGATALYGGHMGADGESVEPGWGPYEHLHPSEWLSPIGEGYRRCCTSICWVGEALAVRLMGAEKVWDHDAFFVYVDRWMHEDDAKAVEEIKKAYPDWGNGVRQGTTVFDPWIDAMWAAYRKTLQPPPDGWKPKE